MPSRWMCPTIGPTMTNCWGLQVGPFCITEWGLEQERTPLAHTPVRYTFYRGKSSTFGSNNLCTTSTGQEYSWGRSSVFSDSQWTGGSSGGWNRLHISHVWRRRSHSRNGDHNCQYGCMQVGVISNRTPNEKLTLFSLGDIQLPNLAQQSSAL